MPHRRGGLLLRVPITAGIKHAVELLEGSRGWYPAINTDGSIRDGAWVAEATGLVDLTAWPEHTRLVLRKERPHPGAQLTFTDHDGLRVTAFITDTAHRVIPGQLAGLELRHREHARVEDRIRQAKASGLRGFPCRDFQASTCWLEIVMAATDLVAWTKLIGFTHDPDTARCEIAAFRYRILHTAARLTRGAGYHYLKLDRTWKWSATTATGWHTLKTAFTT